MDAISELRECGVSELLLKNLSDKEALRMAERMRLRNLKRLTRQYEYSAYLKKPHWQEIKNRRLAMDKYKCTDCGGKAECVHHKHYDTKEHERMEDIISLCKNCHSKRHGIIKQ